MSIYLYGYLSAILYIYRQLCYHPTILAPNGIYHLRFNFLMSVVKISFINFILTLNEVPLQDSFYLTVLGCKSVSNVSYTYVFSLTIIESSSLA